MTLLLFLIWDVNAFSSFLVLCTGGFWCWTRDSDWRKTTALMGHKLQSCTVTLRLELVTLNFNRDWPAHTHKHWVLLWAEYSAGWLSVCVRVLVCELSCVRLFATLWTVAHQVPLSMVFSRQEHRSGLPFPPPGHLPHPELICVSSVNDALAIADPLIDQAPLLVLFHCRAGNRKRKLGRRKCNKSHDYFFPFPELHPVTSHYQHHRHSWYQNPPGSPLLPVFILSHLWWGTMQVPELVHQLNESSSSFHVPWSDSEGGLL